MPAARRATSNGLFFGDWDLRIQRNRRNPRHHPGAVEPFRRRGRRARQRVHRRHVRAPDPQGGRRHRHDDHRGRDWGPRLERIGGKPRHDSAAVRPLRYRGRLEWQGSPARTFPVDNPQGLACDALGNLYVTSTTTVRLLPAAIVPGEPFGVVDGSGAVQTVFGAPPRDTLPASAASCLTGIAIADADTVQVTDACTGMLIELWRQPVP